MAFLISTLFVCINVSAVRDSISVGNLCRAHFYVSLQMIPADSRDMIVLFARAVRVNNPVIKSSTDSRVSLADSLAGRKIPTLQSRSSQRSRAREIFAGRPRPSRKMLPHGVIAIGQTTSEVWLRLSPLAPSPSFLNPFDVFFASFLLSVRLYLFHYPSPSRVPSRPAIVATGI